jgi:protein-S-isoprenylcysteine O-methyltransferase Ste14
MAANGDNPGVIVFPPLLMALAVAAALVLHWLAPLRIPDHTVALAAGIALILAGIALAIWGKRSMDAAGTNVRPSQPTTAIVSAGPFRFTRNPLYIAQGLLLLGITTACGTWWGFIALVPAAVVLHYGIVLREERYLEGKFGAVYLEYKGKVRRYL